ncbi:MAG TPA: hypothetical protein VLH85_03565 [Levilinea sp.]|nr:hypothetical protein [Levilinea sp.]
MNHNPLSEEAIIPYRPAGLVHFIRGVLLPLRLGLTLFYLLLRPAVEEFALMLSLMTITTLASVFGAYAAYRAGWINHIVLIAIPIHLHLGWDNLCQAAYGLLKVA